MEENKKSNYPLRLLLSFLISSLIFAIIFLVAYSVSYFNYSSIAAQNDIVSQSLQKMDYLFNQTTCSEQYLFESSQTLDQVGKVLSILEKRLGKDDSRVLEQKKFYVQLEIKHSLIIDRLSELCNAKFISVFFFYSNKPEKKDSSDSLGYIISTFKQEFPRNVMVYSFDYDLNSSIVLELRENYNITRVPSVIVNKKYNVEVNNIKDLERFKSQVFKINNFTNIY